MEENNTTPRLPAFNEGEIKKLNLAFREVDGKVEITVASKGMNDDINEMAIMMAFALEKMLDS